MQEFMSFLQDNLILSLAWIGLFIALMTSILKEKTAPYRLVSPNEATRLVNHESGVFIDVRSRDDFRTGHITDSVQVTAKEIQDNQFNLIEKYKNTPIILVCKTGKTAIESANALTKAGFENLNVLKDGLIAWNEANLPLVRHKKKK